ncbi:hypothetical protein GUITHDRAFT_108576 [Guillardia theta CCMP2712]|uniref:Uncharacterized protein n=1 Tax=Guillardia theta (strain CCMP2712) TaxID=905079 RepID=L1JBL5_GUITC|nr:hypothetical protein GUITHDRAFT_108576 [Guillardia theta CCMP2712]EKX45702.1 hypothetical protein GUITHDRAFT_108576 [Guillardia theta CCMP2712]|eukprot:XP_005832682.1 hypothetical protein GUITHDRAFT_108576 [Guillardia theta CCMP2712]
MNVEYQFGGQIGPGGNICPPADVLFSDIANVQTLFASRWPLTTITDETSSKESGYNYDYVADGNAGAVWNYGSDFGGGSDSPSDHKIFGKFGVTDSAYSNIKLCPGTAGASCSG